MRFRFGWYGLKKYTVILSLIYDNLLVIDTRLSATPALQQNEIYQDLVQYLTYARQNETC